MIERIEKLMPSHSGKFSLSRKDDCYSLFTIPSQHVQGGSVAEVLWKAEYAAKHRPHYPNLLESNKFARLMTDKWNQEK